MDKKVIIKSVKSKATIFNNNIEIEGEKFEGTPGLWELLTSKTLKDNTDDDYEDYQRLMLKTNAIQRENDPNHPKASGG